MTTLYLSGPMTGLPEQNFPAFHAAARRLRAAGYTVINPAEIEQHDPSSWIKCMWTDLAAMAAAEPDGVAYLPDWTHSEGAWAEVNLIRHLGLRVHSVNTWIVRTLPLQNQYPTTTTP